MQQGTVLGRLLFLAGAGWPWAEACSIVAAREALRREGANGCS